MLFLTESDTVQSKARKCTIFLQIGVIYLEYLWCRVLLLSGKAIYLLIGGGYGSLVSMLPGYLRSASWYSLIPWYLGVVPGYLDSVPMVT